jgi:hypothetical protein
MSVVVESTSRDEQFLALVREWVSDRRDGQDAWVEWIAGSVREHAVVVLSQWVEHRNGRYETHPIDGRRFILSDYGLAVYGDAEHDVRALAADAALEIQEPDGPGVRLDVPWAEGLTSAPAEVQWHGDAIDKAPRSPDSSPAPGSRSSASRS